MVIKKILPRIILYGLLVAFVIFTIIALRWHQWNGYTCRLVGDGIAIYSDYDQATVNMLHRFARAFRRYFETNVLPLPPERKVLRVYLFKNQTDYYRYCRRVRAGDSPFGFYSRRHRLIILNGTMGFTSLLHEMVHYFMHHGKYQLPEWMEEGLAVFFFDRGMGYCHSDYDYLFLFGYLNPVNFNEVQSLAYTRSLSFEDMASSQQIAGTFFVFADRCKSMVKFLQCYLSSQDLEASCHQAFGLSREETEKVWTDFVRNTVLGMDFEFWRRFMFFFSREEFVEWLEANGARWDQEREIYTTNR